MGETVGQLNEADTALNQELFPNLVKKISKEKLDKIGRMVKDGYDTDIDSRSDWIQKHATWLKLFALDSDPKTFPWVGASNVNLPVLSIAAIQFQARALDALLPSKQIAKIIPLGKEEGDEMIAARVQKYMNYQLMFKMREFMESMDKSLLKLPVDGTVIRKTFFDPVKGRIISDYVSPSDFVINYYTRSLEDSERYTHVLLLSDYQMELKKEAGIFENVDDLPEGKKKPDKDLIKDKDDKIQGVDDAVEEDDPVQPRKILEQHLFLKLNDNDKIRRPYIVTIDEDTQTVLRVVLRENPLTGQTMNFFTAYHFIPNPEGFYGYGFGLLLQGANEAINTLINQLIDAGLLSNLRGGFVNKRSGMKRGSLRFDQGEFKEVDLKTDDIKKAIFPLEFSPPSNVLFSLIGLLQDYSNRITSVSELLTGAQPKSDTPAASILAVIEQGLKVFTAVHKRTHISFQKELEKMFDLNGIYWESIKQEYFKIVINSEDLVTPDGMQIQPEIILAGLEGDFRSLLNVQPVSDSNVLTKSEKIAKAQTVYQTALSNPLTANNLQALSVAYADFLKAIEVDDDIIQALTTPPPPPPPPPDLTQIEENALFFSEQSVDPLPDQNHAEHIAIIDDLREGPHFREMSPSAKDILEKHKQKHLGFLSAEDQTQRLAAAEAQLVQGVPQAAGQEITLELEGQF